MNKLNIQNIFLCNLYKDIDLVFITESRLHRNISNSLIDCQGFNALRPGFLTGGKFSELKTKKTLIFLY